jgi:hypothetical protein
MLSDEELAAYRSRHDSLEDGLFDFEVGKLFDHIASLAATLSERDRELAEARSQVDALVGAMQSLFDADHYDHFFARMSDSEMVAIKKMESLLATLPADAKARAERVERMESLLRQIAVMDLDGEIGQFATRLCTAAALARNIVGHQDTPSLPSAGER